MSDSEYMSAADFAAEIEWEGGVLEALEYGLKSTDLNHNDPKSHDLYVGWKALELAYDSMRPIIGEVEELLEAISEQSGEDDG